MGGGPSISTPIGKIDAKRAGLAVLTAGGSETVRGLKKGVDKLNEPAERARREAEAAAKAQQAQFDKMNADLAAQQADEAKQEDQSNADSEQQKARKRQKQLAAGAGGRSDTILTSPLGVTEQAATAKKTLLGA